MMVTLVATTPCFICGYRFKVVRVSSVRINKNSLKETGVSIVMTGPRAAIGFVAAAVRVPGMRGA